MKEKIYVVQAVHYDEDEGIYLGNIDGRDMRIFKSHDKAFEFVCKTLNQWEVEEENIEIRYDDTYQYAEFIYEKANETTNGDVLWFAIMEKEIW